MHGYSAGPQFDFAQLDRLDLEREVQNLVGPIRDIDSLSRATLYGIRDRARRDAGAVARRAEFHVVQP